MRINEIYGIKGSLIILVILSAFGGVIILLSFVSTSLAAVTITTIPNFSDMAPTYGVNLIGVDYAPQVVDYNQDGLLDIFLASWWSYDEIPSFLFRNLNKGGHWLGVRVRGSGDRFNTMGIGAVVRVYKCGFAGKTESC